MNKNKLGSSDLNITKIGFGAWAIGGEWAYGWGKQEDQASIATIHKALDAGINWIDTAPIYGLGHSEEVIGQALKQTSHKPYIFTKCGLVWDDQRQISNVLKKESIKKEAENSLRRLGVDTIDLYQIHWPLPDEDIEEAFEAMVELQKEGKVRYIAGSNLNVNQMKRLSKIGIITSNQPKYNAIARDIEDEILPYSMINKIGSIVYSPMGSGLLTGKMTAEHIQSLDEGDWRKSADDFIEPKLSQNLAIVEKFKLLAKEKGCTVPEIALAWVLNKDGISGAICGMRSVKQVEGIIRADQVILSDLERSLR